MTRKRVEPLMRAKWVQDYLRIFLVMQLTLASGHATQGGSDGAHRQHKCVHDTHVVPQVSRWSSGPRRLETEPYHVSRRQLLATSPVPSPIRITPVFQVDNLDIPRRSFLSTVLVPAATRYLQRLYKVKYPVSGTLLLKRSCEQVLTGQWSNGSTVTACAQWAPFTCLESTLDPNHFDAYKTCDAHSVCSSTPAGAGLTNTDFILYVTAKNTSVCQTGTIAYASFCTQDDATDRPTSGSANFCPDQINPLLNWAFQLDTAVHELTHALGFSAALFKYYRDANNVPLVPRNSDGSIPQQADLSAVVQTFAERGTTATKLVTPRVTQAACDQFGCSTLNGAELENDGGSGTAGSHWEERIFFGELMTAVSQARPVYSKLTAATLEDSGWYVPTYDVTQPLLWGQGRGCAFPLASCAPGGIVPFDPAFAGFYCGTGFRSWTDDNGVTSTLDHTCTDDEGAVGFCQGCNVNDGTCFTDGCMPIIPLSNYVCTDASLASDSDATNSSNPAFWGQAFGVGSRCISDGSHAWSKDGFERPPVGGGCFRYQCSWDVTGTQATLTIMVGGQAVTCIDGQEVPLTDADFDSGSIGPCPTANTFCENGGCVNDCSNQGICVGGTCKCLIGWAGTDCSQLQCNDGVCPTNYACDPVSGVCLTATAFPSPSPSASPSGSLQPAPSFSPNPSPSPTPSPAASPAASALPAAASPSPSVQPSPSAWPLTAPATVSGIVYYGYLANCTLCMDTNGNRQCDDGEVTTVTNTTGGFEFRQVTVQNYGPVLLRLGDHSCVDSLTNLSPTTIMVAPLGSAVVSPLTTFLQALMDVGFVSESQSESAVRFALRLPSTAQITSADPIQGVLAGSAGSLEVLKAVAYLNNVAAQFGSLLAGAAATRSPSVAASLSLAVYRAMATFLLDNQALPSPASDVPSSVSAETVPLYATKSGADVSGCSELAGWPKSCSVERSPLLVSGNPAVDLELNHLHPRKTAEQAALQDVSSTSSLNLTDVTTLQGIVGLSVQDAVSSGALPSGAGVTADVVASVVSLAANSNALVAAVGAGNGSQTLQTLSQIGATARGSVLDSIQEMGAGNISVATFTANSAPDRLALIAATRQVAAAVASPLAAAPAPAPAAPPPPAAAAATVTIVRAAGNGVYLIGGLLVGLFLVLGATIGFIFWRWRRLQLERAKDPDGWNAAAGVAARGSKKSRSKRQSGRVTDEGEEGESFDGVGPRKENGIAKDDEDERNDSGAERNGTASDSVLSGDDTNVTQSESDTEGPRGRRHGRVSSRQHPQEGAYSDDSEGSGEQSDGQENGNRSRKHIRKQPTRGRPRLESGRRLSGEESESEGLDKALILNRGTSTAVQLPKNGRKAQGLQSSQGEPGPDAQNSGSYIYAPQQIIIINQGNGAEGDPRPRAQTPQTPRYGPRPVPAIAATTTATLALEAAPHNADADPYVTVPSEDEGPRGGGFSVTEVRDESASDSGTEGTVGTERTEQTEQTNREEETGAPLRSGAKLPVNRARDPVKQTSLAVTESFSPTKEGLIGSSSVSPVSSNPTQTPPPAPKESAPARRPAPPSRTALPVKESFGTRDDGLIVSENTGSGRNNPSPDKQKPLPASGDSAPVRRSQAPSQPAQTSPVVSDGSTVLLTNPTSDSRATPAKKPAPIAPQTKKAMQAPDETSNSVPNITVTSGEEVSGVRSVGAVRAASPVKRAVPQKGAQVPIGPASPAEQGAVRKAGPVPSRQDSAPARPDSVPARPDSALIRPDSAPMRPSGERVSRAAAPRPQSAAALGETPSADSVRQASPKKAVPRAPSKPAWEEGQGLEGSNLRPGEPVGVGARDSSGKLDGGTPQKVSPVRTKSPVEPSTVKQAPSPQKVGPATQARSFPKAATAAFTFDVDTPEEDLVGQLSRSPSQKRTPHSGLANLAGNPPPSGGFATISLALMKKGAPPDISKQPSKGRQPSGQPGAQVMEQQASIDAPVTVLSATRTRFPSKGGESKLAKEPPSPQVRGSLGGDAASPAGADRVPARVGSPRAVTGGGEAVNRASGPPRQVKPAQGPSEQTRAVPVVGAVVDLSRKSAR